MAYPLEKGEDEIVATSSIRKKVNIQQVDQFTAASFHALAENAPDIICRFNRQYIHLYVNPAIEKATGIPTKNFIGKEIHKVGLPPEFAQFWNMQIQQVFATQKPGTFEFSFPTNEGMKYFQSSVVPEYDEFGEIASVLSISRDITPIREYEKEKDELLAMVTHELRSPITSVKVFAELLRNRISATHDKENETYITKLNAQIDKLIKYINDLLDATGVGAGKMQFKPKTFSFYELIKETVDDCQKTTTSHTIQIKKLDRVKVVADRSRVKQSKHQAFHRHES